MGHYPTDKSSRQHSKKETYRLVLAFLNLVSHQTLWPTSRIKNHQQCIKEPEDGIADDHRCFTATHQITIQ